MHGVGTEASGPPAAGAGVNDAPEAGRVKGDLWGPHDALAWDETWRRHAHPDPDKARHCLAPVRRL
jgi:hypothetical protein